MDTTFAMREQTDTNDPMKAPMISGCTKQFRGYDDTPDARRRDQGHQR